MGYWGFGKLERGKQLRVCAPGYFYWSKPSHTREVPSSRIFVTFLLRTEQRISLFRLFSVTNIPCAKCIVLYTYFLIPSSHLIGQDFDSNLESVKLDIISTIVSISLYAWILRWLAAQTGTPPTLQICIACHFSQAIPFRLLFSYYIQCLSVNQKVRRLYGEKCPVSLSLCSQSISHITAIYRISLNRIRSSIYSLTADEKEHQARKQLLLSPSSLQHLLAIITKRGNHAYYNWLARRRHGRKDLIVKLNEPLWYYDWARKYRQVIYHKTVIKILIRIGRFILIANTCTAFIASEVFSVLNIRSPTSHPVRNASMDVLVEPVQRTIPAIMVIWKSGLHQLW